MRLAALLALGALLAVAAVAAVAALDNQWEASHAIPPCDAACQERQARATAITLVPRTVVREWSVAVLCRMYEGGDVECDLPASAMDPPPEPAPPPLTYPPGLSDVDRALFWLRCTTLRGLAACGPAPMPR